MDRDGERERQREIERERCAIETSFCRFIYRLHFVSVILELEFMIYGTKCRFLNLYDLKPYFLRHNKVLKSVPYNCDQCLPI